MTDALRPDICVIGAGSGGLTVAAAAAAFGVDVVLVERGRMGGDCLNHGCVPSKALIAAARAAAGIRKAPAFGVSGGEPEIDFARVHAHVHGVIEAIAPHDSVQRFEGLGVRVIQAEACFLDGRTVAAGGLVIAARRFVIATGSSPRVPSIPGLSDIPFLTNETIFDLTARPDHLVVVGGGPIGLELAQAHRRLGAAVTVIEGGRALAKEDADLSAVVLRQMRAEGVDLEEETKVLAVRRGDGPDDIRVTVETKAGETRELVGSHLLVAVGRTPNTEGLGLDRAGVDHDAKGIRTRSDLRTRNRRIYAIGDVAGGPQFTHLAGHHAGLVVRSLLFRVPGRVRPDTIPRATYTDPELGQVGLTEAEARGRRLRHTVLTWPYADNDRAQADRLTQGFIKIVVGPRGRILGAGVVGEKAGEMTNLLSLAVSKAMTVGDLQGFVSPYPTYSEIGKRAATAYYAPYARRGFVRKIVRLLARLG